MAARFTLLLLALVTGQVVYAQQLPDKIRGYKVNREILSIEGGETRRGTLGEQVVDLKFGEPELLDVSIAGLKLGVDVEFEFKAQSGKIDFISFHNVRVNGIPVTVEEFKHPFKFKKTRKLSLPAPITIVVPATTVVRSAWGEVSSSRTTWSITGRLCAFGKFRKLGFSHKRAVPVDFQFTIPNPLGS